MPVYEHSTDDVLLAAIAGGDENAFTKLFYRYTPRLFPFVARLLGSELWAEEVVQDVFATIWQSRERLATVENPSAYIYKMAANRTLNYISRHAREIRMQYHIGQQLQKDKNHTEGDVDYREAETLLHEAIQRLPSQRRKVFTLIREQGLSHFEAAEKLRLSKNTIHNHMTEALHSIRTYLKNTGSWLS